MTLSKTKRIALIALGYIAAALAGGCAVWLKNLGVSPADMMASSGMYAFGDLIFFVAIASFVSILPTVLLLGLIDPLSPFWKIFSIGSLPIAFTGLVSSMLMFVRIETPDSLLASLQMVGVLRVIAAPFCILLFLPGLILTRGANRWRFLVACALEVAAVAVFVLHLFVHR